MSTILVMPDLQIPFHHPRALRFLCEVRDKYKPDEVVNVGDEVDNCALSRYPKDPNGESAGTELKAARRTLARYYVEFPVVKLCESNHRQRLYKRAYEAGIPTEYIADVHEYLQSPAGWQWADQWIIDGIVFEHGDRANSSLSGGDKLVDANHASTVYGHHSGRAGVSYRKVAGKMLFSMNVGCLVDETGYGMNYLKMARSKPVLGCGIIVDGVPQFLPYHASQTAKKKKKGSVKNRTKVAIKR